MPKTYTINNKQFTLAEVTNKRKLKFAKILGANKISEVQTIFGKTEDERFAKADAFVFDLMVDDSKLHQLLCTIFVEGVSEEDAASLDNPEQLAQMVTDFFSPSPVTSKTP